MPITYAYTILYVKDVPQSIQFYKTVFDFEQKFVTPEKDYGELISGSTTLAFASLELGNANLKKGFLQSDVNAKPFGIELVFASEDIEKLRERAVAAGGEELEKIVTKPWGQQVGYIRDLDGFLIEICTPMKG